MNINEQLGKLLADLGVEMEQSEQEPREDERQEPQRMYNEHATPEISIFQSSRDHYGVFYRLDIIDSLPQLRIMVPVDNGALKMEMYLAKLSERLPINTLLASMACYRGSSAFEHGREAALQHLLYAIAEMVKQLFWAGDLESLNFPPEITVRRLL